MKSLRIKLFSAISMFVVTLALLIVGVWAVGETQTITMNGNVTFNIVDDSLYVKDVKIKQDNNSESASISSFMPGYINGNFDMDLTNLDTNTLGSFNLYFYIINTSNNIYNATLSLTGDMVQQNVSVTLENSQIPATTLTDGEGISQDTPESVILILQVSTTSETSIDLSDITINIDQIQYVNITTLSSNTTLGSVTDTTNGNQIITGEEITLTASFTGTSDADFLGWRANSTTGELVSTLPEYTFTYEAGMPTTFCAIFEEPSSYLSFYTASGEGNTGISSCNAGAVDIVIPSQINRDGNIYTVTTIEEQPLTRAPDPGSYGPFYNTRTTLENVILPETLEVIGMKAFEYCSNLKTINIADCINLTTIGIDAFLNCSSLLLEEIDWVISSNIYIALNAFVGCNSIRSLEFTENVTDISTSALASLGVLNSITVSSENQYFSSENGILYDKNKTEIILYPKGKTATSFTIPSTVTSVGDYAFYNCSNLTEIILPSNLLTIEGHAFEGCNNLVSINLPNTITDISHNAFQNCSGLTEVVLPSKLTIINTQLFSGCNNLVSVNIPDGVTTIGSFAFSGCSSLKSIDLPDCVTNIENGAFSRCSSLTEFRMPANIQYLGDNALSSCSGLITLDFSNITTLTSIGRETFSDCSSLKSVNFNYCSNLTSIGSQAFVGCEALTQISFTGITTDWNVLSGTGTKPTEKPISLSNASTNARYFTDTYCRYNYRFERAI